MAFIAEERRKKFWFGTEQRCEWFATPNRGADVSPTGWEAGGTLLNGGGYQLNSFGSHKNYIFEWPEFSAREVAQKMKSYADGTYGRGLIYFIDPLTWTTNMLPAQWADPSMALGYEGTSLVYGVDPVSVPTSGWESNDLPVNSAYYDLGSVAAGWRGKEQAVFIPIPTGYTLSLGSFHSQTGTGRVYYREQATNGALGAITAVTPQPNNASSVLNTFISGANLAGVWLYVGKSGAGAGSVTLTAMIGRLIPSVKTQSTMIAQNLFTNPNLVGDGTYAEVYRNLWRTPAMSNLGMVTAQGATLAAVAGGVEVTRTGSSGRASTNAGQRVTITPGTYTITARRQVDAPVGNTGSSDGRLVVVGYDSTGSHRSNAYRLTLGTAPTVGVETISEGITPPEWVTSLELSWYSGGTNGDRIIWGDVGVITDAGSYFDGDYSYDPDLTPSWVGAANASQSVLTGVKVAGIADPRAILSTEWDGVPSLRVLGGQIAETFGEKMTPFETSLHPGTISAVDDTVTPPWVGAAPVAALWDSGQIAYTAGMPEESLPGMAYVYGCALRTTGGDNPQSIYGSFTVDAPQFAIMVTAWDATDITVMVNRKPMSVDPVITGGGYQFIVVDGLGAGTHQVDFIVGWGSNLLQVLAPTGSTIAPGAVPSFRLGLTGDSYADSGIAPYYAGLARELWLRTGWSIYQLGQGSTGYTNDGSSSGDLSKSEYGSPSRLAALAAGNVDALLVIGSVNDGSTPPATVKTAVADYLAAVAPIPVLLAGVEPLHLYGVDTSAWDAVNVAVMEAASEAPNVRLAINWRADNWLTGTGSVSQPRGDGNQDIYIGDVAGTDTIHPNYAGQQYFAGRFVTEFTPVQIQAPSEWMPFASLSGETVVIRARFAEQAVQFGGVEHYPSSGGEIRVSGTGSVDLSEGWWTDIGLFAGVYDGPAFSGDSGTTVINGRSYRTQWDGTPDNSTSSAWTMTPEFDRLKEGPWIGGQGHSGCRFIGKPTYVNNTGVDGGQVSFAASFREVGLWVNG